MPVEIREMVVRAIVPPKHEEKGAGPGKQANAPKHDDQARIIEECVSAVLKVLEKRDRR